MSDDKDGLGRVNWWLKVETPEGVKVIPGVCLTPLGQETAARALLWCYRHVRTLFERHGHVINPGDVEELAHDAAVKAAVTWDAGRSKLSTWAAWHCRAAVSNFFRHRDRRPDNDAVPLTAFGDSLPDAGEPEAAGDARRAEAAERLGAVFARLRQRDRDALTSAYIRGDSCDERKKVLGCSRQAVSEERKRAMERARKAARAISKGVA